jgi:hypothetical protein
LITPAETKSVSSGLQKLQLKTTEPRPQGSVAGGEVVLKAMSKKDL